MLVLEMSHACAPATHLSMHFDSLRGTAPQIFICRISPSPYRVLLSSADALSDSSTMALLPIVSFLSFSTVHFPPLNTLPGHALPSSSHHSSFPPRLPYHKITATLYSSLFTAHLSPRKHTPLFSPTTLPSKEHHSSTHSHTSSFPLAPRPPLQSQAQPNTTLLPSTAPPCNRNSIKGGRFPRIARSSLAHLALSAKRLFARIFQNTLPPTPLRSVIWRQNCSFALDKRHSRNQRPW